MDYITRDINNTGKFQVVGWAKRGDVMDQGVSQPNNGLPHNALKVMVQSGTLNHHIIKLEPMTPSILNSEYYDGLQFNVETGFNVSA